MSQHFLLSAKARTLSVRKVMELTNDQAFEVFKEVRWGTGKEVACPVCGTIGKHYFQRTRKQWRCKDCNHHSALRPALAFALLEDATVAAVFRRLDRSDTISGIEDTNRGVDLVQALPKALYFLLVMLDQPGHFRTLAD